MEQKPVAQPWALLVFAGIWVSPVAVRLFVKYPMFPVLAILAWVLAVLIAITWCAPTLRRIVFIPDAEEQGGATQIAAAVLGMILVGFVGWFVLPTLDPE
jgi:hypothetical protein